MGRKLLLDESLDLRREPTHAQIWLAIVEDPVP
jgi:hypothetical protein